MVVLYPQLREGFIAGHHSGWGPGRARFREARKCSLGIVLGGRLRRAMPPIVPCWL